MKKIIAVNLLLIPTICVCVYIYLNADMLTIVKGIAILCFIACYIFGAYLLGSDHVCPDDEYDDPDYSTTRVDDSKCACGGTFEKVGDPIIEKDKVQHGQFSMDVYMQTYECNQCETRNWKVYAGSMHGYLVMPPKR